MLSYLLRLVYDDVVSITTEHLSDAFFSLFLHVLLPISYRSPISSFIIKKIVGANEGLFVEEIVALVAEACESDFERINHSTKVNGKWVSVTCHAPVQNAEMLYALYEKIDLDPRVKFKF
jgi:putative lipoic acid-binding regulatory protein